MSQALAHTFNARQRVVGVREKVNINGVDYDALVERITFDDTVLIGAIAEGGGYKCQVAVADLPGRPNQYSSIIVRGETLSVLDVTDVNGVAFEITAGDPAKDSFK